MSPHLRMMLGEAFILVNTEGKVGTSPPPHITPPLLVLPLPPSHTLQVVISSTSLPHCEASGGNLSASTALPGSGSGPISIAKTFVTQSECGRCLLLL